MPEIRPPLLYYVHTYIAYTFIIYLSLHMSALLICSALTGVLPLFPHAPIFFIRWTWTEIKNQAATE